MPIQRNRTRKAVETAREFLAAAEAFQRELEWLKKADAQESEELYGCTMIKLARLFEERPV